MAIKIQTQDTYIPVAIGDLELKFYITDESILNLKSELEKALDQLNKDNSNKNEEEIIEEMKNAVGHAYDSLFGKGTFDKVYEITPSVSILMDYFMQITEGLSEELKKRGYTNPTKAKANKYLNKKNKKLPKKK